MIRNNKSKTRQQNNKHMNKIKEKRKGGANNDQNTIQTTKD